MSISVDSVLSSVMGNDDLMNKIKNIVKSNNNDSSSSLEEVISLIAPTLNQNNTSESKSNDNEKEEKNDTQELNLQKTGIDGIIGSLSSTISKSTDLLIALKPYLCHERCQLIDGVIKISRLADTIKLL